VTAPSSASASRLPTLFLNTALFQAGWFAVVLGAARGRPWSGMAAALGLSAIHVLAAQERRHELLLGLTAGALGFTVDTLLQAAGVLAFDTGRVVPWLAPPWLIALWVQFASLLRFSLRWLDRRPVLAGFLGLVGGPAAFLSGERLGAVSFPAGTPVALGALALVWAAVTPLLLALAARLAGGAGEGRYRVATAVPAR
jgi:hypothetical protein